MDLVQNACRIQKTHQKCPIQLTNESVKLLQQLPIKQFLYLFENHDLHMQYNIVCGEVDKLTELSFAANDISIHVFAVYVSQHTKKQNPCHRLNKCNRFNHG